MEVIRAATPKEEAGKVLTGLLEKNQDKTILLLLSGGSAFTFLDYTPATVLGPHITVTVLDERYSVDVGVNNFAQLERTTFYQTCVEQGVDFISTKVLADESMEGLGKRFQQALRAWKEKHPDGIVLATMGIGPDGHTAGIFNGDHGVDFDGGDWVVEYTVDKEVNAYTERVTVTNTFLKQEVSAAVVFAVGTEKKQYIDKLSNTADQVCLFPACVIRKMAAVWLITDETVCKGKDMK